MKHTTFLALILVGNIFLWIVENISGVKYELLTISYIMAEGLILLLYSILQDYEASSLSQQTSELFYTDVDLISMADSENLKSNDIRNFSETQIKSILMTWPAVQSLTQREFEVLRLILERRKRKDIAQVLFVTESTIKKHTSNIYQKLSVSNRRELFDKAIDYISK